MDGSDTVALATFWPGARVYAVEPVSKNFRALRHQTQSLSNVSAYCLALGSENGSARLFESLDVSGGLSGSSSLLRPTGHLQEFPGIDFDSSSEVPVRSLDDWAGEVGIDRLDLAWLDLQGMEIPVLESSPKVFSTIRAVHMEVHRKELYAGSFLYDEVRDFMSASGFRLAIDRVGRVAGNVLFVKDP